MSAKKVLKVVVDRTKWLRGQGGVVSYLLAPPPSQVAIPPHLEGKMCCLGFACKVLDYTDDDIRGFKTLGDPHDVEPEHLRGAAGRLAARVGMKSHLIDSALSSLYATNDSRELKDAAREAELIRLGAKINIEFTFIN
jgi:hypothetical protein